MSQENVDAVRRAWQAFERHDNEAIFPLYDPEVEFRGWPEQQIYEGTEQARGFIRNWTAAFGEWEIEVEVFHDAGDKVMGLED